MEIFKNFYQYMRLAVVFVKDIKAVIDNYRLANLNKIVKNQEQESDNQNLPILYDIFL